VVDHLFSEPRLAVLYDRWHPWEQRADFAFYVPLVLDASSVLDVGCGTGELLRVAREQGHGGRLCGLDPAAAMLDQARSRTDVEWVLGDLSVVTFEREFDLVVMTGHAFQVLVTDDELRVALAAGQRALRPGGRFVFETRNPTARGWEAWAPEHAVELVADDGAIVRAAHRVVAPFDGRTVTFTVTFTSAAWPEPRVSHSTLRFLAPRQLDGFLAGAGLRVTERFGDFDRQPLTEASPEIVVVAERA
jgi:SAM-dependent methyltransferase